MTKKNQLHPSNNHKSIVQMYPFVDQPIFPVKLQYCSCTNKRSKGDQLDTTVTFFEYLFYTSLAYRVTILK